MHSSTHHGHNKVNRTLSRETKGLILNGGWRYDLTGWFHDIFSFRGQWRVLRQRSIAFARLQPGEQVLDVGCGTGTLALEAAPLVGRVAGVDPGALQIARARAKAARRKLPVDFQIGAIEQLPFPDQTFDVVFSTLMMHHLPKSLKRQGLGEIRRVLKPGGRLIIADFTHRSARQGQSARFHAGGSNAQDLIALVTDAGFEQVETEEMQPVRFSTFPGASLIRAYKR